MIDPAFWQGRRVFLTGHTGFKGSWLSLWLQRLGADVTGYALAPPTEPNLFQLASVARGMSSIEADVRDFERLRTELVAADPEIVIHMAAQPIVRRSYRDPVETYGTNVMGTVHLLESVRACGSVRSVVVVTSDKCYENREQLEACREDDAMGGYDPYSSSKGCVELVVSAFRRSYFAEDGAPAAASARAGNVIGGGDWSEDRLVPDIVKTWMAGEAVRIRNPMALRPWQHVLEPLRGYLLLAQRLHEGGQRYASGWNFGPADEDVRPVSWVADELARRWGGDVSWRLDDGAHPHEAHSLTLNCEKALEQLGWRPQIALDQALDWISEWYAGFMRNDDPAQLVLHDIERYELVRVDA